MTRCPNKTDYMALDKATVDPVEMMQIKLWKINVKLMATIAMGEQSKHGIVMCKKTNSTDFPSRLTAMRKKCKPINATAEIQMEQEVDNLKFGYARQF